MSIHPFKQGATSTETPSEFNPLEFGIQLVSTEAEMLKRIAQDPFRNAQWRSSNRDLDLFRVYLQQVVVPNKPALRIGLAIHKALKISLYQQNPEVHNVRLAYFSTGSTLANFASVTGVHEAISILGLTGTAKSFLIKAALASIPQRIKRVSLAGMDQVVQIVWLYVDLSGIASVEALADRIVEEIDAVLCGAGAVRDRTFKGVRGAHAKMTAALRLLKTHYCGLLILDEIQFENFAVAAAAPLRSWVLRIMNRGIGVVLSGNPLGFKLQLPNRPKDDDAYSTQIMRRMFSTDKIRLDPAPKADDPNWTDFTKGIDRCRLFGPPHPFDKTLHQLKFERTGGFPDFYVHLHVELEKILATDPSRAVDKDLIELAARQSTKIAEMQPLIAAFAQQDVIALSLCADGDHEYYERLWLEKAVIGKDPEPPGPVGIIAVPPSTADPAKTLAAQQKAVAIAAQRRKTKASKKMSGAAAAVREGLAEKLTALITGKVPDKGDA
jgi:hypothetical protein